MIGTKTFEGKNVFTPGISPTNTFDVTPPSPPPAAGVAAAVMEVQPARADVYVIAGGPCSGKTTLLTAMATAGFRVEPETAERVINEGIAQVRTSGCLRVVLPFLKFSEGCRLCVRHACPKSVSRPVGLPPVLPRHCLPPCPPASLPVLCVRCMCLICVCVCADWRCLCNAMFSAAASCPGVFRMACRTVERSLLITER